ncbi:MAG TPA: VOC family protein [Vicinamibacterales bacterium]|nr:VOC family protein [Vicinamibacterales bacterium]
MATATESTLQARTISPSLTVNDVRQSLAFFENLGFVVEDRWEEQGKLLGVMLRAGDARIGLMQDDWKKGRDRQKGVGMRLFLSTKQNIDQLAAQARTAGVKLDSEPHDTEWKSRVFDVTEPSGFQITISSEA